jgi:heptosyltransferase-1
VSHLNHHSPVGDRLLPGSSVLPAPASLLVVKLGPIGEVIHALPAVRALRTAFPQARLGWVVEQSSASLVRSHSWIDAAIEWDRRRWGSFRHLVRRLRRDRWDVAADFQGTFTSGLIARLTRAPRRVGFLPSLEAAHWFYNEYVPLESLDLHAVERNLALATKLGGAAPAATIDRPYLLHLPPACSVSGKSGITLEPSDEDLAAVEAWRRSRRFDGNREQLVVLNPHSSRPAHRWPAQHYIRLVQRLLQRPQVRVALAGGVGSREVCDEIAAPFGESVWRADGRFSPLGMAALFSLASAVVSGDAGPLHLAAAVGAPVIALFGASNSLRTGPYTSEALVLEAELACSPCLAKTCPLKYDPPLCMEQIHVDRVLAAVLTRLEQSRTAERWRRSA